MLSDKTLLVRMRRTRLLSSFNDGLAHRSGHGPGMHNSRPVDPQLAIVSDNITTQSHEVLPERMDSGNFDDWRHSCSHVAHPSFDAALRR